MRMDWRSCTRSVSNFLIVLPHEDYRGRSDRQMLVWPGDKANANLDSRPPPPPLTAAQKGVEPVAWHKIMPCGTTQVVNVPTVPSS